MRSQFTAAATSVWATSNQQPCPVSRARITAASTPMAAHTGATLVPMLWCSSM
jgi:hypothetical protein